MFKRLNTSNLYTFQLLQPPIRGTLCEAGNEPRVSSLDPRASITITITMTITMTITNYEHDIRSPMSEV